MAEKNISIKIVLGIATMWPILYMFIFFGFIMSTVAGHGKPETLSGVFPIIMVLHMLAIFSMFGLIAIYIVDLFKSSRISKDTKVLWAVILFFGNMLAMPVYWYMYIWKSPDMAASPGIHNNSDAYGNQAQNVLSPGTIYCPQCGFKMAKQSNFCMRCGHKMTTTP